MAAHGREPAVATYLAERYWPGLDEPTARSAIRRLGEQAAAGSHAGATEVFASIFVPHEEAVLVLVRAGSVGDVAGIGQRAGIAFDRIVEAIVLSIDSRPEDAPRLNPRERARS